MAGVGGRRGRWPSQGVGGWHAMRAGGYPLVLNKDKK